MEKLLVILLLLVGLVNALPVMGVVGAGKLAALYGMTFADDNLAILMRHRAVLFGLVGGFIMLSAFKPALRSYAICAGFVSMLSFVALAISASDFNAHIKKIVIVDIAASVALAAALALHLIRRSS